MDQFASIKATLARLEPAKLAGLIAAAVAVLVLVAWVAFRPAEPKGLLYAGLDPAEAGKIAQHLDEMKVPYEARGDGGTIMVPVSEVARVRMELAAAGLPHQEGAGYELLDSESPMNMTSFMQRVQWLRALEGELSRTIVALDGVRVARVHIVMPERDSFSRDSAKPTASVAVVMGGVMRLSKRQALAIRLLVSGAVPGLKQEDVSVLDPSGVVLAATGSDALASSQLDDREAGIEQQLQQRVDDLLDPLVGRAHVRTEVTVKLDESREITREEKFDPQSQVERSKQTQVDSQTTEESKPEQAVTVTQNIPTQPQQEATDNAPRNATTNSHKGETVNYEINTVRSERVREPGEIARLTVAVAVDGTTDSHGVFHPRSQAELDRIRDLVRSAVGYDAKRGDQVTVDTMPFLPPDSVLAEVGGVAASANAPSWMTIGVPAGLLLVVGAGAILWRRRQRGRPAGALEPVALSSSPSLMIPGTAQPLLLDTDVTIAPGPLANLHLLVEQHPDEALALIKSWIAEGSAA